MSPTSTIALPTRPTFRPTAGILAAAVASLIIGAGVITQDVEIGVATATEAPTVAPVTYDPLDFSATVTAFDDVIPDFMAVNEPARATTYEDYINRIAAAPATAR